jgi:hypothetical protein
MRTHSNSGTSHHLGKTHATRARNSATHQIHATNLNPHCIKANNDFHLSGRAMRTRGPSGCHVNAVYNSEHAARELMVANRNVLHDIMLDEDSGELIMDRETLHDLKSDLRNGDYTSYLEDLPHTARQYLSHGHTPAERVTTVENARNWLRNESSYSKHPVCPPSSDPSIIPYNDCGPEAYNNNLHPFQAGMDIMRADYAGTYGSSFENLLGHNSMKSSKIRRNRNAYGS